MIKKDTIAAIATAPGVGAVAIIRLSGEKAIEICDKIFIGKKVKKLSEQKPYTIHYGEIVENNEILDDVLVSLFRSPRSYTGENSVEISCHGSVHIQQRILQAVINNGARLAEPGEFTMRAFLNGKLDLSQAEAVADLIASKSEAEHRTAIQQIRGGFTEDLNELREKLLSFITLVELELDFSEEHFEFVDRVKLLLLISEISAKVDELAATFKLGNAFKKGIPVAIIGEPNVGKSTLLNVLLNDDKALVSDIAGTTRDSIEDTISLNGILFRFIDTAGIRQTDDKIEGLGIERTNKIIDKAEIVILVTEPNATGTFFEDFTSKIIGKQKTVIVAINKIDEQIMLYPDAFAQHYKTVLISAKQKKNIDELEKALLEAVNYKPENFSDTIITNARHYQLLTKASQAAKRVEEGIGNSISGDFLAQDIREILNHIGEITGEITDDEILGNIFKNFCIGK